MHGATLLVLTAATLSQAKPTELSSEKAILAAIRQAAEVRQAAYKSVRVVLSVDAWRASETFRDDSPFAHPNDERGEVPKSGVRNRSNMTLSLDGARFRFHESGEIPTGISGKLVDFDRLQVFDGERHCLMDAPSSRHAYWSVITSSVDHVRNLDLPSPLLWHVRLRDPEWVHAAETVWGVADERVRIGTAECVVVAFGDGVSTFAFDPDRRWILRRYLHAHRSDTGQETSAVEIRIEYSDPAEGDPRPVSWTRQRREKGRLLSESKVKVVDWTVAPEWPEAAFEIRYPARSVVTEYTRPPKPQEARFVIDAAGERHDVDVSEWTADRIRELLDGK